MTEAPSTVEVHGEGPTVLLPVNPRPVEGPQAEELRRWGADPALGRSLIEGLGDAFQVVAFDYEGHVLQVPKPDSLTPANLAGDLLAVADAAGADRFAYYGYSWLALAGLQLAIRSDRVAALVMGGYPPLDGPYTEMLQVTAATHELAVASGLAAAARDDLHHRRQPSGGDGLVAGGGVVDGAPDAPVRHPVPGAAGLRRPRRPGADQVPAPLLRGRSGRDRLRRALGRGAGQPRRAGHPPTRRPRSPSAGRWRCSRGSTTSRPCRPPRSCPSCAPGCWPASG